METIIKKINFLIENKLGNSMRLEELLERINSGKKLYNSDIKYVERLYPDNNNSKIEEIQTKSETDVSTPIKKSQPKNNSLRNIPNNSKHYGITYNIYNRDEVKIHKSSCSKYERSSQIGSVKWLFVNSLKDAKSTVETLYPKYGDWKCPRCCLYNGAMYFECNNCKRYSEDFNNKKKLHSKRWRVSAIILLVLPILIILSGVQPRLTGLNLLLIIIGFVILAIENYRAPLVCRNCLSKNWKDHFVYR